jgi:hypothetical protein
MWNFDLTKAPRGSFVVKNRKFGNTPADTKKFEPDRVVLATKCGQVLLSQYLPDAKRWEGLATGEQPVAWHPFDGALPAYPQMEAA